MKKFVYAVVVAAAFPGMASAQAIYGYGAQESESVYTSLDMPTVIYDGSFEGAALGEEIESVIMTPSGEVRVAGEVEGFDIGFDFPFCGKSVREFVVSGAGYVVLGNGQLSVNPDIQGYYLSCSGDFDAVGSVPQRGARGLADTRISYAHTDEGLVIQFENYGVMTSFWGDPGVLDMHIRLGKDGSISYTYGSFDTLGGNAYLACGLRDGERSVCVEGDKGDIALVRDRGGVLVLPEDTESGYELTMTAPERCEMPDGAPAEIKASATSSSITFSYSLGDGADNILAVYSVDMVSDWVPEDGIQYTAGDETDGVYIAYYGDETEFTNEGLESGKDYYYRLFSVSAFGIGGPVYNTDAADMTVATLPGAPAAAVRDSDENSITLDVTPNDDGNSIVVLITDYCERDAYGDKGLFGKIPVDVKTGDVLPVPEDFELWMDSFPMPENGGTVVYTGEVAEGIKLEGLDPSTGYFIAVYSRNGEGVCSSDAVMMTAATWIKVPYDGNSDNFPRFLMPQGWATSEDDAESHYFSFRDECYGRFNSEGPAQGTQLIQQCASLQRGNAEGMTVWMTPQPIVVDERHVIAKFEYSMTESSGRFDTHAYNDWADGDVLEILVSDNGGESWQSMARYEKGSNPEIGWDEEKMCPLYTSIEADLNAWRGKTVTVKLQWTTHTLASWGAKLFVDRFSVTQGEFPEIPEVSVGAVSYDRATIAWKSVQTDYELAWKDESSEEANLVSVDGCMTYTLENLTPLTKYSVRVRGVLEGENNFSEWSDPVEFTTSDWPPVEAPENLVSDLDRFYDDGTVMLRWDATDDMESFIVAYRESSSTQWTESETADPVLVLDDLSYSTKYIWKVRALCTHGRETEFSAQANFTTPEDTGEISALYADDIPEECEIYTPAGVRVRKSELYSGIYIIRTSGGSRKIRVK